MVQPCGSPKQFLISQFNFCKLSQRLRAAIALITTRAYATADHRSEQYKAVERTRPSPSSSNSVPSHFAIASSVIFFLFFLLPSDFSLADHLVVYLCTMARLLPASNTVKDLLIELMKIDSTTTREAHLAAALSEYLRARGWTVREQHLQDQPERFNILVTKKEVSGKGPRFLFNSHLDTVPPFIPPSFDEENIYGRGSNDAKGQVASMIKAAERLTSENPELSDDIGLLFVVGEETDHIGMIEANKLNLQPEFLIVGEPTDMKFARLQKGATKFFIKVQGKAAHSGYPHMGESAIEKLLDILHELRAYSWPSDEKLGSTTMNIGFVKGGQAVNALAAEAEATLMFRVTKSVDEIMDTVKRIVGSRGVVELYGRNEPVQLTEPPPEYESHVVSFNTDIPYFANRDKLKATFLFGPGSITNAHSKDEFMPLNELEGAVDVYVNIARKMLS
uniref:M20_dimer domain-containing protein n=1 Tax=Steinernema glaseri TaxID=37863 RepID=A0A1I7ZHI9_9BILA